MLPDPNATGIGFPFWSSNKESQGDPVATFPSSRKNVKLNLPTVPAFTE